HDLPVGVVSVDRNFDIQSINGVARRLLGIHTPAMGEDITHLSHRPLSEPLRDAVQAVLNGEQYRQVHELTSFPDTPGQVRYFEISSALSQPIPERPDNPELVVITIADVTEPERERAEQRAALQDAEHRLQRVQQLLDESTRSVRRLLAANQ